MKYLYIHPHIHALITWSIITFSLEFRTCWTNKKKLYRAVKLIQNSKFNFIRNNFLCLWNIVNYRKQTWWRSNPGKPQGTVGKITIGENVGQTKCVMIGQRVQVQEITDVDVWLTEGSLLKNIRAVLRLVSHYLKKKKICLHQLGVD